MLTASVFFQEFYGFRFNIQVLNPLDYFLCCGYPVSPTPFIEGTGLFYCIILALCLHLKH